MTQATMLRKGGTGEPSAIPLRQYQQDALREVERARARGVRRQLLSLPTGAGKTILAAHAVRSLGYDRCLFVVHRDELAKQTRTAMRLVNPDASIGIVKADADDVYADIVIGSAQTLAQPKRLERLRRALEGRSLLHIEDECHHSVSPTRKRTIDILDADLLLGLTATPARGDGAGLDGVFQEIVYHLPMRALVDDHKLARPVGLRVETAVDLDSVRTTAGELNEGDLERTVDTPARNALVVDSWQRHASDRTRTVAFCVSVAHARHLRDCFRVAGVASEMVDGTTPIAERERIFRAFSAGEVRVLTNCMVLTEGYDEPRIDCVLMARPTKSSGLYVQCVGRGLRWAVGKEDCLVLDFVDATTRHALVTLPSLAADAPRKPGEKPVTISEKDRKPGEVMDLFDALAHEGRIRERKAIMVDLLGDSPMVWHQVEGGGYAAPSGQRGVWLTVAEEDDGFVPVRVVGDGKAARIERLLPSAVDAETAMAVAQEQIPSGVLVEKAAPWRVLPPTEPQRRAARSWKVTVPARATRGEVSDLLDIAAFNAAMRRARQTEGTQA